MALPLLSSLACSRLKPEGIRGFGPPHLRIQTWRTESAVAVLWCSRFFVAGFLLLKAKGSFVFRQE